MVVVALDRAITSLSPVLPPRPALPLLPAPKVSEPKRKSRRERPVRRRVFRARHACVLLSFSVSPSSLYAFYISASFSAGFARRASLGGSSPPTLRSIVPDTKVEAVQFEGSVSVGLHAVTRLSKHSCGSFHGVHTSDWITLSRSASHFWWWRMIVRVGGNLAISIRLFVKHRAYGDRIALIATECIFMVYFLFPEFFFSLLRMIVATSLLS